MKTAVFLLAGGLSFSVLDPALAQEQCPADPGWLTATTFDESEPDHPLINDCGFYQRAWQAFLGVAKADPATGQPRFVGFDDISSFLPPSGPNALTAAFPTKRPGRMSVALRLVKESGPVFNEGAAQADGSLLVSRDGRPVFYSIHIDPVFATFIRTANLNDPNRRRDPSFDPDMKAGAVEIKAAWIQVDEQNPPSNYILADASVPTLVQNGDAIIGDPSKPLSRKLALLGIHVVFSLENHPEMIWATFEHIGNGDFDLAPRASALPDDLDGSKPVSDQDFMLYVAGTSANMASTAPDTLTLDAAKQTLSPSSPVYRRYPWSQQKDPQHPEDALMEDDMIKAVNEDVAGKFMANSPSDLRRNYKLVGAVWIAKGSQDFKAGVKVKDVVLEGENGLSNVSMESFTQAINPNCFGCHQPTAENGIPPKRINVSHIFPKFFQRH